MKWLLISSLIVFTILPDICGQHNLLPNGGAENIFINQLTEKKNRESYIDAEGTGLPTMWNLSKGASVTEEEKHSGKRAIQLESGKKEVKATVLSNFWRAIDKNMPFGLPLIKGREITVSFYYKVKGVTKSNAIKAIIKLGTINGLPTKEDTITLSATNKWKLVKKKIVLDKLLWGGNVIFSLLDSTENAKVWIDDVFLGQKLDGVNLVKNHSFEKSGDTDFPKNWQIPLEDQWVSWVGAKFRKPVIDSNESITGIKSLRATVTYTEGSGVSQLIPLHQKKVKPIAIDIWSKLNNSIGNKVESYHGPDNYANLTIYAYHYDGTMQEINPTFCLGESDHDWDYRRFGFLSTKPVKEMLLQITVLGSEPTTSLFVDEIHAYEIGTNTEQLENRGIDFPRLTVSSGWGKLIEEKVSALQVNNDENNLYIKIPKKSNSETISVYLNAQTESKFNNHYRYLFDVIKIDKKGNVSKGITVEKQGYTAEGEFKDGKKEGITKREIEGGYFITVPFISLQQNPLNTKEPFGFNVKWDNKTGNIYWNGNAANNKNMGRIILSKKPGIRIKNIEFGKRYYYEKDQSQDFISQPQLYAGENEAIIDLENKGKSGKVEISGWIKGELISKKILDLKKGEIRRIILPYQAGVDKETEFNVVLSVNGKKKIAESFPIVVPPAIEIVPDQEHYYPEEKVAKIEINNRYRPLQKKGKIKVKVTDLKEKKIVDTFSKRLKKSIDTLSIDISKYRVNSLPIQDYLISIAYYDDKGKELGKAEKKFGKINHTIKRELPPIKKVSVDDKGRIVINDNFRFFPIEPSLQIGEWDEVIKMGANTYRGWYSPDFPNDNPFKYRDLAWKENAYFFPVGPYKPKFLDKFQIEAESLLVHPGALGVYAKQWYYWGTGKETEWLNYRKRVEKIVGNISSPRLVVWGHHDSSLLYDWDMPEYQKFNPLVGYCYVKIMGRPGSVWRNSPFLTKTEMVLNPHRFKLAEVNYYVSWHADEPLPMNFRYFYSLRGDDWHGVRNETYQAIINGAHGVYNWLCMQEKDLQRMRGYYQELNYMWPIYVADDAENKIEIIPNQSTIDVRLKRWKSNYYLLTANRDETTKTVKIKIDGFNNIKVKKLFELNNELTVKDNLIRDTWRKYDVHVYRIEK